MCTHAHLEDTDRASHTDHYRVGTAFSSTHPGLTHHTSTDSPAATSCPRAGTDNSSLVQAYTHPSRTPSRHTHRCPEQEQGPSAHCHSCPHPSPSHQPYGSPSYQLFQSMHRHTPCPISLEQKQMLPLQPAPSCDSWPCFRLWHSPALTLLNPIPSQLVWGYTLLLPWGWRLNAHICSSNRWDFAGPSHWHHRAGAPTHPACLQELAPNPLTHVPPSSW